jgi:hypothetical protein
LQYALQAFYFLTLDIFLCSDAKSDIGLRECSLTQITTNNLGENIMGHLNMRFDRTKYLASCLIAAGVFFTISSGAQASASTGQMTDSGSGKLGNALQYEVELPITYHLSQNADSNIDLK